MSIKQIHTLKSQLKMSDADYRALLRRVAGVGSSKLLTPELDRAVVKELDSLLRDSFRARPKTKAESKIWALWLGSDDSPGLSRYLPEEKRNPGYLAGIVSRFGKVEKACGVIRFDTLESHAAFKAIEALKERIAYEQDKLSSVPF